MAKAVIIKETGGAEVLKLHNIKVPSKIPPNYVLVRQSSIGINFNDILYRNGTYKYPKYPVVPGIEACGVIEAVGEGVKADIGRRVIYCTAPNGSYCEYRLIHQKYLVGLPEKISDEVAVSSFAKAITAHYLLLSVYLVDKSRTILVNAAAGGVGSMLCQWAKFLGARIIGVVGSADKIDAARDNGCDKAFLSSDPDLVAKVMDFTGKKGVNVAYDSVGKDTIKNSIACTREMGLVVSYGQSSGAIKNFNIPELSKKNIYLASPTLRVQRADPRLLTLSAIEVFTMLDKKHLKPKIFKEFNIDQVSEAHKLLESRQTIGSIILKI